MSSVHVFLLFQEGNVQICSDALFVLFQEITVYVHSDCANDQHVQCHDGSVVSPQF